MAKLHVWYGSRIQTLDFVARHIRVSGSKGVLELCILIFSANTTEQTTTSIENIIIQINEFHAWWCLVLHLAPISLLEFISDNISAYERRHYILHGLKFDASPTTIHDLETISLNQWSPTYHVSMCLGSNLVDITSHYCNIMTLYQIRIYLNTGAVCTTIIVSFSNISFCTLLQLSAS